MISRSIFDSEALLSLHRMFRESDDRELARLRVAWVSVKD